MAEGNAINTPFPDLPLLGQFSLAVGGQTWKEGGYKGRNLGVVHCRGFIPFLLSKCFQLQLKHIRAIWILGINLCEHPRSVPGLRCLVQCHTGEMAHREPGSICSQPAKWALGTSAAKGRAREDLVQAKRGKRERVLVCPVPKGQIQRLSEEKLKELVRGTLN